MQTVPSRWAMVLVLFGALLFAQGVVAEGASQQAFVRVLIPLFGSAAGGVSIGSVTPGTAVKITAPAVARDSITIDGWSQQSADTVIYSAVGQRIVLTTLTPAGLSHRKVLDATHDTYGNVWNHVQISGYADSSSLVPNVSTVWTAAHQLYSTRCSACHALHATTDFSANQWPGILKVMGKNAALTPQDTALITQYLQTHGRAP